MNPTLAEKLRNVAQSARTWVVAGMPIVPKEVYVRRLDRCSVCPFNDRGTCRLCGCVLEIKAWAATEGCPDIHPAWGPEK
jgi:hypothetical protein